MQIIGIMAVTEEGVIGNDLSIPWNYPAELEYFRKTTKDHVIVMGRKTFETVPLKLFSDRIGIIFSKNNSLKDTASFKFVHSLEDFLHLLKDFYGRKIFVIGGADLVRFFLKENLISEFFLTKIHKKYLGDTYIDLKLFENWMHEIIFSNEDYSIIKLQNPSKRIIDGN